MKTYKFTSVIWKEKEGYVSKCPELGVASAGDTVEEALKKFKGGHRALFRKCKGVGDARGN